MDQHQEWFTVVEAAEYLRVSRRTIYSLVQRGRLTSYRIGKQRHMRFRRADLDRVPLRVRPHKRSAREPPDAASTA